MTRPITNDGTATGLIVLQSGIGSIVEWRSRGKHRDFRIDLEWIVGIRSGSATNQERFQERSLPAARIWNR